MSKGTIKAVFFLLFIVFAVYLMRYTDVREYLNPEVMQQWVHGFGPLAPLVFIALYGAGISLFLPATVFTGIGALLFGALWGFFFNIAGAMLGASVSFFIGRYLGRDFAASLIGDRLKKYDRKIAENGFATTLYLRLVFFPFTPLNFGMGLTAIDFKAFFFGTFLGIIAGGFAMTFFFATLAEVWKSGQWTTLLSWTSLLALVLFVGSFFIPALVKRIRPESLES
ncbi:MAG: hypothetical protein Kow0089_07450 [Desulfobulbaceae bacterium]